MIETLNKTDFIVSWFAKKYNKTIFRVGNLNEDGCRVWETDGKKYMCFWDTVLERYSKIHIIENSDYTQAIPHRYYKIQRTY